MRQLLSTAALCLALGACATNAPGTTASAYDGTYTGTMTSLHTGPNSCAAATTQPQKLTVQNGAIVWASGGTNFYAPVRADGAFAAQNGTVFFNGKITNNAMVARVNTGPCHQLYDLTKTA